MITEPNKVIIPGLEKNNLEIEINWNLNAKEKGGIKFTINGQTAIVKREDIFSFMFVTGTAKQQEELMPIKQTTIMKHFRQHRIVAKKDIKAGEQLVVNCEVNVPIEIENGIAMDLKRKKLGSF